MKGFTGVVQMIDRSEFEMILRGYGLTTARFVYRMPDHPSILQEFIWQEYDLAPKFPALHDFIDFWHQKIEGPLHSVIFTHKRLISGREWRNVSGEMVLN